MKRRFALKLTSLLPLLPLFFVLGPGLAPPALAASAPAGSRCADCHFANPRGASQWHLSEWENSAHGRNDVGCERCHGGDPSTFESFRAHQGMLGPQNPASPIHRQNLPTTCGGCHPGPLESFQKSRHYALLREGSPDTPICTTCHGAVGAFLLSPKALAAQCNSCHGAGKAAVRTDLPAEGRMRLQAVRDVRAQLDAARKLIRSVRDKELRAALELEARDAEVPIHEAVQSAHTFVFEAMEQRLEVARRRIDLLNERLANPKGPAAKP